MLYTINPENLVQTHTEKKKPGLDGRGLGENAVWNELEAVKNDEVYLLDMNLFHCRPNARFVDAYKVLAKSSILTWTLA